MSALSGLDEMAMIGFGGAMASCSVIPPSFAISGKMFPMMGNPDDLMQAGTAWFDVADQLIEGLNDFNTVVYGLSSDGWCGKDFEAFKKQAEEFHRQTMVTVLMAYAIGTIMVLAALMVAAACLLIFGIGTALLAWAVAIWAAMASVVGFLGPVEALIASATTFASTCYTVIATFDTVMSTSFQVAAGVLTGFVGTHVGLQMAMGNEDALGNLVEGTVVALPTIAAGLVTVAITNSIGRGITAGSGLPWVVGGALGTGGLFGYDGDPIGDLTSLIDPFRPK